MIGGMFIDNKWINFTDFLANGLRIFFVIAINMIFVCQFLDYYFKYKYKLLQNKHVRVKIPNMKNLIEKYNKYAKLIRTKGLDIKWYYRYLNNVDMSKNLSDFLSFYRLVTTNILFATNHEFTKYITVCRNIMINDMIDILMTQPNPFLTYIKKYHKKLLNMYTISIFKWYMDKSNENTVRSVLTDIEVPIDKKTAYFDRRDSPFLNPDINNRPNDSIFPYYLVNGENQPFLLSEVFNSYQYIHMNPVIMYMFTHRIFEKFNKYLSKNIKKGKIK